MKMYKCNKCNEQFEHPEVKLPDAGMPYGILGRRKIREIRFCPECMSVNIEKEEVKKAV
jgi:DNA-directed RNA polymerase subunit RPC12/RpoP|nr:MAG TPA: RUBREDOXIN REDUCTASE, RUBREDOXIN 2 DEGRADATION, IRON-SULFUR PROTEIN, OXIDOREDUCTASE [Caudoviricetes sp.]